MESNKELLGRYLREVWHDGDVKAARRYLAPDYRRYVSPVLPPLDRDGQLARLAGFRAAFPNVRLDVEGVLAEGDLVSFRATMRAAHEGELLGIAATGRSVTVGLVDIVRVVDDQFAEHWGGPDLFDLLRQIGATWGTTPE